MRTLQYNAPSKIIVTIDDSSLVKKVSEAVKMIKGVSSVKVSKTEDSVLNSTSYKAGMRDIKNGNVTIYASSDDMFKDLRVSPKRWLQR